MTKQFKLTVAILAVLIAATAGIRLLEVPNKINSERELGRRRAFCDSLVAGDRERALGVFNKNLKGYSGLVKFVNLPARVVQCYDQGAPWINDSPGLLGCPMKLQAVVIKFEQASGDKGDITEGEIYFRYTCNAITEFKELVGIHPRVNRMRYESTGERTLMSWEELDKDE